MRTALIVVVPEAEPVVAPLRLRYDPSARLGVPAHLTVLFPFAPRDALSREHLDGLAAVLAAVEPFAFELRTIARFPATVYLEPAPAAPFAALTAAIARRFPEHPPYGGRFPTVIPHLTVADLQPENVDRAERELAAALAAHGPIRSHCREIALIEEDDDGRWRPRASLALRRTP